MSPALVATGGFVGVELPAKRVVLGNLPVIHSSGSGSYRKRVCRHFGITSVKAVTRPERSPADVVELYF